MRVLVFTATRDNVKIALEKGVMGFSERRSPTGDSTFGKDHWDNEPTDGDRAVLVALGDGNVETTIVGVVDVTSSLYRSSAPLWEDKPYPLRVTFRVVATFSDPIHLPEALVQRAVIRHNPRLLNNEEAEILMRSLGEQLISSPE